MLSNTVKYVLNFWSTVNVCICSSQAARENVPFTFTSVAAVSVWTPAWCVTDSPTVPTVQMRARDVHNATAPAYQLLSVTTTVSAPQMDRSVQNRRAFGCFSNAVPNLTSVGFHGISSKLLLVKILDWDFRNYFISLPQLERYIQKRVHNILQLFVNV